MIENMKREGIEPEFRWVPAHIRIEGNERADKAAKEATGWRRIRDPGQSREVDTDQTAYRPPGYSLVTAMGAVPNSPLLVEWKEDWANEKTGRELTGYAQSQPLIHPIRTFVAYTGQRLSYCPMRSGDLLRIFSTKSKGVGSTVKFEIGFSNFFFSFADSAWDSYRE
jgi:hypothetical protein